jgi:hypothetical protein
MKRYIVALIAGATVFAAAFGVAATLGVSGGTIQAGVDSTLYCDNDGVQVLGWTLEAGSPSQPAGVYGVRIGGIDADCFTNSLFVRVSDGDGNLIGPEFGLETISSSTVTVPFSPPLDPALIEDLHVYIEGPVGD